MSHQRSWVLALGTLAGALAMPLGAQNARPAAAPGARAERALALEEALRVAEQRSEAVRIAAAGVRRARGQQYQARSQYFPQLTGTASFQKQLQSQFEEITKRFAPEPDPNLPADTAVNPLAQIFASENTLVLGLSASQNLFAGGRIVSQNRAATAARRSAEVGLTAARAQVQLDVTQAYYDAVLSDRLLAIAESSLVQTERTLRQTQLARNVGNTSEFDLLRARVTRDNQRPQLLQARSARDVAYLRLRQLLDIPLDEPLRLTTELQDAPPPAAPLRVAGSDSGGIVAPVSLTVDPAEVLAADPLVAAAVDSAVAGADTTAAGRSSVRQLEQNVRAQRGLLRAARGQRLPALNLSSTYQRFAYPANYLPESWRDLFPNWTVTLGLSVPLFTGGRIRGDELVAQANLAEAEHQLQQTREFAALDATLAITQLEQAQAAWLASQGTTEQAARAYTIAEVRYSEGLSTQIELNDSRLLLQQAQANRAQSARDLQVARVRLALLRDLPLAQTGAQPAGGQQQQQQQQPQPSQQGQAQSGTQPSAGAFTQTGNTGGGVTP